MQGRVLFRFRPFRDRDGTFPVDLVNIELANGQWLKLDARDHAIDENVQPGVLVEVTSTGILWWKKYSVKAV
jgi:hypothetical protein